ncbi:MAG: porin family protein [Rhodothermales bacterium]
MLFAVGLQPAQAQERLGYGVKLGVTAAELHNRGSGDARWGATGSFFVTSPLSGTMDFLGEIGYHAKGSRGEDFSEAARGEFDSRFNYIFLLAAPQYANTLGDGGLRLFAFAGPRADLFLGETFSFEEASADSDEPSVFLSRSFSPLVLGVAAGIGLDFARLLPVPLIAELRYNGDITPAYTFFGGDEQVRNRTFDLRLGLSF